MPFRIGLSGLRANRTFSSEISRLIGGHPTQAVGLAVAYGSVAGVDYIHSVAERAGVKTLAWVADASDCVTQPNALRAALTYSWNVRAVDRANSTFHPKLYVGGDRFVSDSFSELVWFAIGSPNLSRNGLSRNVEAYFRGIGEIYDRHASAAFNELWSEGTPVNHAWIDDYEKRFAERNRKRSPKDLIALGVTEASEEEVGEPQGGRKTVRKAARPAAYSEDSAAVAWAGLESFTGDYMLQLEFPKRAALVLRRLIGRSGSIKMICEDGIERDFTYRFYDHNGMFRLNIPNETPGALTARQDKEGIGLVSGDGGLRFQIIPPGKKLDKVVARSVALGTWGKTPTRLYGWY